MIIPAFMELSNKIGPERVIWRYDPVLISPRYTVQKHIQYFEMLAKTLEGFTEKCIISFVDMYRNTANNAKTLGLETVTNEDVIIIAQAFSEIAERYGLELCTCSEAIDLSQYGISHAHCIDKDLLERLTGCKLKLDKDVNQRKERGCAASIDIGAYNTCKNMCRYCYANYNENMVSRNDKLHHPQAPLLFGDVGDSDRVTERKMG